MSFVEVLRALLQIGFFATAIYVLWRFLRTSRGSGVVRGLTIIMITATAFYVVADELLGLEQVKMVFNLLGPTIALGLIIVFHPEIRRALVSLGDAPLFGNLIKPEVNIHHRVLRAVARMQKERVGALIVIERRTSLDPYLESGIRVDAEVNSALIESIFHPGNALHDGAMIIRNDRIAAASCILPLSDRADISDRLGTRHRAAVGLAEETDAFTIVVSEETGKISVGVGGRLHYDLSLEDLEKMMAQHLKVKAKEAA